VKRDLRRLVEVILSPFEGFTNHNELSKKIMNGVIGGIL